MALKVEEKIKDHFDLEREKRDKDERHRKHDQQYIIPNVVFFPDFSDSE
jgi:hypothetical protein